MSKDDFIKQVFEIIFSCDDQGYPLPPHSKLARVQILAEKYQQQQKQEAK